MNLGKNIRAARMNKNYTQEELARRIGVSKNAISNYETGFSTPKLEILFALMVALDVDANFMYDRIGTEYASEPWHQSLIDDYWAASDEFRIQIVAENLLDSRIARDYERILQRFRESLKLTPHERDVILAYRRQKEMQASVDRLLQIESESVSMKNA